MFSWQHTHNQKVSGFKLSKSKYVHIYLLKKKILTPLKYLHTHGLVGLHGSLKTPCTSPSLHPWAIDWVLPELTKPGPLLTHTALSPRSLSQNSWMQTRHMRPLSGLCAVREGALLPGCRHSLRLWLFLHALCVTPTFSPLPPLYHIYGPGVSMSVKGFSAAPIIPRRNTWYLGNKEFWDWELSLWTAG